MPGKLLAIGSALLLWGVATAEAQEETKQLGELFCTLTNAGEQFSPRYLLTPSLVAAIQSGLKKSDEWAKAHPDEKPPLGDGIQYASFPDGAPVCRVGAITDGADGSRLIDIEYIVGAEPANNWTDRLVVRNDGGLPRIDDVLYGMEKYELGLRKSLAGAFDN